MEKCENDIVESALDLVSDCIPQLAPILHSLKFPSTIADAIFANKLKRLLSKSRPDFDSWAKMAWRFDRDQKQYKENVGKLIYFLNAMNEDKIIDVYANLLRAYQLALLDCEDFFRLSWILTQVYYQDLLLLKEIGPNLRDKNHSRLASLQPYGLFLTHTAQFYNQSTELTYTLTDLGRSMISCGIDFDNYSAKNVKDHL